MAAVQQSLDQLIHVINNANNAEKIEKIYLVTDNSRNCAYGALVSLVAKRGSLAIRSMTKLNVEDISEDTVIVIENKSYEFIQAIETLRGACTRFSSSVDISNVFLEIIHRECKYDSHVTAEKLISLQYPLWQAAELVNAEVIEHMIIRGCPVDDCHPVVKCTALSKAVERMNLEIVKVLVKYGADVDFRDVYGRLPIAHYYRWSRTTQETEIIKILLDKSKLLKDMPPEELHQQFRGVLKCETKEVIQMVIQYRNDILTIKDRQGETLLHYLSDNPHSDIFELLEGRQSDVNVGDAIGRTPLMMAADSSFCHVNTFKFLLENGANVNARTEWEPFNVALFTLCNRTFCLNNKERYLKIIELFLQYDLDIQFVGLNQRTVFDIIIERKSFYMAEPLLAHLAILEEQGNPITELICNKINSNEVLKHYFELCKAELVNIKNNLTDKGLTLHTILINREEKIFKIYKCHTNSLSKLETLKKQCFPDHAYYRTIKSRICNIEKRIELYRKAAFIVHKLTKLGTDINHLVVIEIMDYLGDQDFYNLINVVGEYGTTDIVWYD